MVTRVAVVTESFLPQINGVTNSVVRVLETLKQHEIEAVVIAPTSPSSMHLGFKVQTTAALPLLQFPVAMPGPSITRYLDEFQPDLIHVAAPFMIGAQAIAWGQRNNVPTVAIYQTDVAGYLERYNLAFAKPVLERIVASIHAGATLNLAPTEETAQYLRGIGGGRVKVWGRGVDLDLFTPKNVDDAETQAIRSRIAPDNSKVVGFVGRLAAEKQVHRMAELFGLPNTRFVIVGDGPERERLQEQFAGFPVTFTGALSGLELARTYAAMDVFVHFGTEETFGQTIQEAQASGLAVVAPNVGGPKHLIRHGVSGFLADPTKPNSYRKLVAELLASDGLRRDISTGAVRSVEGRSWAANNAKLLQYYRDALAQTVELRAEQIELA
ncbi:glycosyltransferase family 1 protein [Aquiluna borgnonia]|uniref:D-inositol 3-phosphate glycosyltransferase n=1 Tax=Aquiluna borgnonia TaxID=2499157 RepID=A0A7D4U750_9MICO|nr:glycosyltransferase family 1 protein [Aquiluna borgnonia]QKJ24736.1 glycosyltransferase family 1 protein [Aquiluna borgnonia]